MLRLLLLLAFSLCSEAQTFDELRLEKVFIGYRFTEGPVWSPEAFLMFCDMPTDRIMKWVSGEKPEVFRDKAEGTGGLALDTQGRLYACETRSRRVTRTDKKGKLEVLADKYQGKRFNAPNDITVRRDGHAWFTDPAFGNQADTRELDFYGIYHINPKGELDLMAKTKWRPNGIALTPNGRSLFVSNSDERSIVAWDVDRNGAATNERVFVSGIEGPPDGIRFDEKGNLWVAAKGIVVYSPAGKHLWTIEMGEKPSNLAFGDPDLMTLYITARTAVYRVRLDVKGAVLH